MKKILSLLLCVVLILGIFAGCASKPANTTDGKTTKKEETKTESKKKEETKTESEKKEPATLKLVIYGETNDATDKFIKEKLRPRMLEELNIDLDFQFMSWSATDQVHTMAMSGEAFGFMHDPYYYNWAAEGVLAKIPYEDIQRVAPDYLKSRGVNTFEWCKDPAGNICCFPMRSMPNVDMDGIAVRNDLLKAIGMDASDIHTYEQFIDACVKVKEKFPDVSKFTTGIFTSIPNAVLGIPEGAKYTALDGTWVMAAAAAMVDENDPENKVVSMFETDYFRKLCENSRKSVELGLKDADPLVENAKGGWNSGAGFSDVAYTQMVYKTDELSSVEGSEVKVVRFDGYHDVLKLDYNWTIAISAEDQDNVENWLRLMNWIYESEEHYHFISIGEEGVDWEYGADGIAINRLSDVNLIPDWMMESDMYAKVSTEQYDESAVAEFWALNEKAIPSKVMGFLFDPTPVATEFALINAICTEKLDMYARGYWAVEDGFDETIAELKAAGLDAYIAEVERQFNEFLKTR